MKKVLAACGRAAAAAYRFLRIVLGAAMSWLSLPRNACLAALGLAFALSFLSWAIGDRSVEAALFFPSTQNGSLKGEMRDLPRARGTEARAELLASEVLLGPRSDRLSPAFPQGTRVETVIYRGRMLYVDISAEAALAEPAGLASGLAAMEKTLRRGIPWLKGLRLTIGGREPYLQGLDAGKNANKEKDN